MERASLLCERLQAKHEMDFTSRDQALASIKEEQTMTGAPDGTDGVVQLALALSSTRQCLQSELKRTHEKDPSDVSRLSKLPSNGTDCMQTILLV